MTPRLLAYAQLRTDEEFYARVDGECFSDRQDLPRPAMR